MRDMGRCSVHPIRLKRVAPLCVIVWVAAWSLLTAGASWAATIKGSVRLAGAGLEQKKLPITVDHSVCGKEKEGQDVIVSAGKGIRNVVVSLQNPPPDATWKVPLAPVQMDQQQCVFVPRVVIVPVGGTVEFLNSDRLLHNIRSRAAVNRPFNRTQPKGRTIPMVFQKPELIRVDCDLHPWMRGWVVVAEHPFYAITNDQGEFLLDNVPPGRYTIQLWQEALGTVTKDVSVADGVTTVTVEMIRK
jgi:plastocyanin